jgi:hypothetical protein
VNTSRQTAVERYLRLGPQLGRHVDGIVHPSLSDLTTSGVSTARIFGETANRMTKNDHAIRAALRR